MANLPHAVQHVAPYIPLIKGFTFMTLMLTSLSTLLAGFGLGWYVKGRGMTGVKIDLDNVKKEVEALKNKVMPSAPIPTV